jgi:hypothetical protein
MVVINFGHILVILRHFGLGDDFVLTSLTWWPIIYHALDNHEEDETYQ